MKTDRELTVSDWTPEQLGQVEAPVEAPVEETPVEFPVFDIHGLTENS